MTGSTLRRPLGAAALAFAALLSDAPELRARTSPPLQVPVEVAVVSYNVHGLPGWIARDDPPARMPEIARRLARYDVVLIQEDWAYHDGLVAAMPGFTVLRGNGPRSGRFGAFSFFCGQCGSGLSLLVRAPVERVIAVERIPFGVCAGWVFGANDCWATKGFLFVRLALPNGAEVDFYNVHLDAGDRPADLTARERQLATLSVHMQGASVGRAVVVGGDWNLPLQRSPDAAALETFRKGLGLEDAGARNRLEPPWTQQIDHVFFRSGRQVEIERVTAGEALEFSPEMTPLSDHPAVYARLRVKTAAPP